MPFRVELDRFFGPLDLLMHLVRRRELEVEALPLADVTQQFLDYVAVLEAIDVDSVGEFLEVASTLIEIKSRSVLPQQEDEPSVDPDNGAPPPDLVQRLLEYKRFRDAAEHLEQRAAEWRCRYARRANELPRRSRDAAAELIQGVELWDLVGAFGRVMRERLAPPEVTTIPFDDTPLDVMVDRVHSQLTPDRPVAFDELFPTDAIKSTLIGIFLALLELIRRGKAIVEPIDPSGGLAVSRGPDASSVDGHESAGEDAGRRAA